MILGIVLSALLLLVSFVLIRRINELHPRLNSRFMYTLGLYHFALTIAYYLYALSNPSDSITFYFKAANKVYGDSWFDYFGNSTRFIDFITFSLVNHFGFTYEACMVIFSWLGFLGFIFFYIVFKEHIRSDIRLFGQSAIAVLLLLPNLHFWSASLGKGSLMFFSFGLFFYGLSSLGSRLWAIVIGGWIIFQIRPHIFYVIVIAIVLGFVFSTKGIGPGYKAVVLSVAVFLLYYIYDDILRFAGLEDDSILNPLISHRATELAKASSGIDITSYSVPEKFFAFWFRPLFFDAPGLLGFIVSIENAFYLIFFFKLLRPQGVRFIFRSDPLVKTSFLTFLGVSIALAQITGNLGLAIRQKSQVMLLMLFVIAKFMDEQKIRQLKVAIDRRRRHFLMQKRRSNLADT